MSGRRLFAVALIFVFATVAWFVLAGSVEVRTNNSSDRLGDEVSGLWGSPQVQEAPRFTFANAGRTGSLPIASSDIEADLKLDQRRKGLLWYATYVARFDATYTVKNPESTPATVTMSFAFPDPSGSYDGFAVKVDGTDAPVRYVKGAARTTFTVPSGATARIETGYKTNGMESWAYSPSPDGADVVKDFTLVMTTDFDQIDYPADGVSPTQQAAEGDGWKLAWTYDSVVSGRRIGLVMPVPPNPGPLVARITAFAPVSLLFFFAALILLTATRNVKLHPVHYGFLAAAFFAFDLLLAYLADQVDINIAFAVASVTSVALCTGYLFVVVGRNRALIEIAISQFIFLVLFSYSFFFEGITGLAITIGAVLTLAFFMARTARVDWDEVFPKPERHLAHQWVPAPPPAQPYPASVPAQPDVAERGAGDPPATP